MGLLNQSVRTFPRSLIGLFVAGVLAGCSGVGTGVSFEKTTAQAEVNENTSGVFWKAQARAGGNEVKYSIGGLDAQLFGFNEATGELWFKKPADFEAPQDNDGNNEYLITLTAKVQNSEDTQAVRIVVKDINKPSVTLVSPKANANVGQGDNVDVEVVVKVYDEESKGGLGSGSVTVNGMGLTKDSSDPTLWKGKVSVIGTDINVEVVAITPDKQVIKETAKWVNKPAALKPQAMALVPGGYLATIDSSNKMMAKIYLNGMPQWVEYAGSSELFTPMKAFDFSARSQTVYFSTDSRELLAANIASAVPKIYYGGTVQGLLSIAFDTAGSRVLVLSGQDNKYTVGSVAINTTRGFASAKTAETRNSSATVSSLLSLTTEIKGAVKQFAYHRASQTYIIADERSVNGSVRTFVQGFASAGAKRFEAEIGGDISNLAVNEAGSLVYVAEASKTAQAKLKAINITNGVVADLAGAPAGATIGSLAEIRMDNVNNKLYVGDSVSDAIFVIDLATSAVTELNHMPIFTGDPTIQN